MSRQHRDLTGQQFGDYTPIKFLGDDKWECQCICGRTAIKRGSHLTGGYSKYCTHDKEDNKLKDMTGKKIGKLTVIEYAEHSMWLCKCDCGNDRVVRGWELRNNKITECEECQAVTTLNKQRKVKLEGQTLGGYKAIKYIGHKKYECQCLNCERTFEVKTPNLYKNKYGCFDCSNILKMKHRLEGKKFGSLTVIEYLGGSKWKCKCDCGRDHITGTAYLLDKNTLKICRQCFYTHNVKDMKGQVIGDWIVGSYLGYQKWSCTCKHCGLTAVKFGYNLRTLKSSVCSCQNSSKPEIEVYEFVKSLGDYNIERGTRSIISPYELDIYIPEKKIAIEFNGTYWHNDDVKPEDYHRHKTVLCAKKGIRLIHIFEHEWENKETRPKIEKYLKSILTTSESSINTDDLEVQCIEIEEAQKFIYDYNMYINSDASITNIGVFNKEELIAVASIEYDTITSITYKYTSDEIVTAKLIEYIKENSETKSIIMNIDLAKFTGNTIAKLGFKSTGFNDPKYMWVHIHNNGIIDEDDAADLDENDLKDSGYLKVYDCGTLRMEYTATE